MTEDQMHRFAEQNAEDEVEETVSDLPSEDNCAECGSILDEWGNCTNDQCSEYPPDVEEEVEEDEDVDDS